MLKDIQDGRGGHSNNSQFKHAKKISDYCTHPKHARLQQNKKSRLPQTTSTIKCAIANKALTKFNTSECIILTSLKKNGSQVDILRTHNFTGTQSASVYCAC